jgi:hypothetical protein
VHHAEKAIALGREQETIAHMRNAVRIDPEYVAARNNLAYRLLPTDPEIAIAHLKRPRESLHAIRSYSTISQ